MSYNHEVGIHRSLTAGEFVGNKVPKKTEWIYSMSGIFRDACYALVSGAYLNYAKTAGLLDSSQYNTQLGVIIALYVACLIWDGFNDPIMGLLIERFHFKTGKFRPWILLGAIGNAITVLIMFLIKPHGWAFVACFGVFYFLWDFVFTMNDIGYWSMLPTLSNEGKERGKLTALVTIAGGIGQATMTVVTALLVTSSNISTIYGYIAIPTVLVFLASQTCVFLFCKERKRDETQDAVSEKTKFGDLFRMVKRNKPLRMVVIAIFFYYAVGAITISFGADYLTFTYGYGGNYGGRALVYFGIASMAGTLIFQACYPLISKRVSLQKILTSTFWIAIAGLVAMFIVAVPLFGEKPLAYSAPVDGKLSFFSGTGWIILIPVFLLSGASGLFYLALVVMMQNAIDYNEWKFGEKREAVAFSWRPLDAKLSAAFKWGLYFLSLAASGTLSVFIYINDQTSLKDAGLLSNAEIDANIQNAIASISHSSLIVFDSLFILLAAICLTAAYLVAHYGYQLTDEKHRAICLEIEERHQKNEVPVVESSKKKVKIKK